MRVYEFLFRGQIDAAQSAWHVVMANDIDNGQGGTVTDYIGPLSMQAAAGGGYTLPEIIDQINAGAMARADAAEASEKAARDELAELQVEASSMAARIDTLTGELENANQLLDRAEEALQGAGAGAPVDAAPDPQAARLQQYHDELVRLQDLRDKAFVAGELVETSRLDREMAALVKQRDAGEPFPAPAPLDDSQDAGHDPE